MANEEAKSPRYPEGGALLRRLAEEAKGGGRIKSRRQLAQFMGFSPSTLAAMCSGDLRPALKDIPKLVGQLIDPTRAEPVERELAEGFKFSIEALRSHTALRIVYGESPPFVEQSTELGRPVRGFCVELFNKLSRVMDVRIEECSDGKLLSFEEAMQQVESGQADCMASVVMSTYQQQQKFLLSTPLPGLRASLAAVARQPLTRQMSLEGLHTEFEVLGYQPVVIAGGAGESYLETFLPLRWGEDPIRLQGHDLQELRAQLAGGTRIGIFDSVTCRRLEQSADGEIQRIEGEDRPDWRTLGSYRLCFAFNKKAVRAWDMVQESLKAMCNEGVDVLATLYRTYRHQLAPLFEEAEIEDRNLQERLKRALED